MFYNNPTIQKATFNFFKRITKFENRIILLNVDFEKPWWYILWQQKWMVLINFINQIGTGIIFAFVPLWLASVFNTGDFNNFIYLILVLVLFRIISFGLFYFDPLLRLQTMKSIEFSSSKFFLNVDPIYHSTRSTGQIVAKVTRGAAAYEGLIDLVQFQILNNIGGIIGVVAAFASYNLLLSVYVFLYLFLIVFLTTAAFLLRSKMFRKLRIKTEDKAKAITLEILQQAQYIRAIYASKEVFQKVTKLQFNTTYITATLWRIAAYILTSCQVLFVLSMLHIGFILIQTKDSPIVLLSLMVSYYQVGMSIQFIGNTISQIFNRFEDIDDLFEFIRGFGKQTFPVLEGDFDKKVNFT